MANGFLMMGGALSATAALIHIACIYFGAPWYRFLGAGEEMAKMAEAGSWTPGVITAGIAIVLGFWSLYAFSAAGAVRRLPMLRTALCIITGIYLLRGIVVLPVAFLYPLQMNAFAWWSSAICLGFGLVHLVGIRQRWRAMSVST